MGQIASAGQLRMGFVRWALVLVPLVLLLGIASGRLANSGYGNAWFDALEKPAAMPPGWAFGAAWTVLYILMGLALAMVVNARGAPGRRIAIGVFVVGLLMNLAWSPTFFALHEVRIALFLILGMIAITIATIVLFARVRKTAAWLLLPYICWLGFAAALNHDIDRLNPNASEVAPGPVSTQIRL